MAQYSQQYHPAQAHAQQWQQPVYASSAGHIHSPVPISPNPRGPTTFEQYHQPQPQQQQSQQQQQQPQQGGRSRSATVSSARAYHRPSLAPSPSSTPSGYTTPPLPSPTPHSAAHMSPSLAPPHTISPPTSTRARPNLHLNDLHQPTYPTPIYSPRSNPSSPAPPYSPNPNPNHHHQRPRQPPSPALSSRSTLIGVPTSPTPSAIEKMNGLAGPDNDRMAPAGGNAAKGISDQVLLAQMDATAGRTGPGGRERRSRLETSPWLSKQTRGASKLKYFSWVFGFICLLVIGITVAYHFINEDAQKDKDEAIKGIVEDGPSGPRATNVAQAPVSSHGRRGMWVEIGEGEMRRRHKRRI